MKRMVEFEISLTFVIIAIISTVIFGCYNIGFASSNFITFHVLSNALTVSMIYMICVWGWTRRHKLLAWVGIFGFGLMGMFFGMDFLSIMGMSNTEIIQITPNVDGDYIILLILYGISDLVAYVQSKKLLEEDNTSKINGIDN